MFWLRGRLENGVKFCHLKKSYVFSSIIDGRKIVDAAFIEGEVISEPFINSNFNFNRCNCR